MRTTLLTAAALLGLAMAAPAFAQSSALNNPAAPSSSQAAPQSSGSLPAGAGAQSQPTSSGTAEPNRGTSNTLAQPPSSDAAATPVAPK